jgi:cell division septum initiation protein DivIVA
MPSEHAVLVESAKPSGASSVRELLETAQDEIKKLEAKDQAAEKERAALLQDARSQAAMILAGAQREADRLKAWTSQFKKEVGPLAKQIVDA